jgi:ribonuclease HII
MRNTKINNLERFYDPNASGFELAMDEAGRGCLFGRVYVACVVLPKCPELFCGNDIKDSKKFSSTKKINEVAEYIKQNAFVWHVAYVEPDIIDEINILQSVMRGMHECIRETKQKICEKLGHVISINDCMAVVDGNYFTPFRAFDETAGCICEMPNVTVEKGDAKYMAIAAASILAKTERDKHVEYMCEQYPILAERYGFDTNMGYGTKTHLDGIREHGITQWHRRTFGQACKTAILTEIPTASSILLP